MACAVCLSVAAVNQAVKEQRVKQTLRVLCLPEVELQGVLPDCAAEYQRELSHRIASRTRKGKFLDKLPGESPPGDSTDQS